MSDSEQTLLCTYLSAVLLVGLAVNALFGWAWADPIAALIIAVVAVKEGREAWRGDACCALPAAPPFPLVSRADVVHAALPVVAALERYRFGIWNMRKEIVSLAMTDRV
ncbi:hypothetical protein [Actinomadura sp. 6N118]|uniref:hypothetical protein n=1 Tax=Actinomadura sp. 6N118 TaxID=3375151 RepID=UPI0037B29D66